jgi:Cysteine-rich CPCC
MTSKTQCDCCDYFTIDKGEDYEICPVCFWEQDWCGVSEPDLESGANHGLTLREGRRNFLKIGACSANLVENVVSVEARAAYRHEQRSI